MAVRRCEVRRCEGAKVVGQGARLAAGMSGDGHQVNEIPKTHCYGAAPVPLKREELQVERIDFTDGESGGDGFVGVRICSNSVGLIISLEADGDIEVILDPSVATEIASALERSVAAVRSRAAES
jgi:hypothetical protein